MKCSISEKTEQKVSDLQGKAESTDKAVKSLEGWWLLYT